MNWIDFSKERPKEEPHRNVLVCFKASHSNAVYSTATLSQWPMHRITHWAEIEPPQKQHKDDLETLLTGLIELGAKIQGIRHKEPPPTPDPFEEAFDRLWKTSCTGKEFAKLFWDAAIRWKEGQK